MFMIFDLNLLLGDGSLYGNATANSMTYKINIQEGLDPTLIVPADLKADTIGQSLISFDTGSEEKKQIVMKGNVKVEEGTDMIRLYTNMDTLVELTKRLPISMNVQKD
jgi:hypothetical protein